MGWVSSDQVKVLAEQKAEPPLVARQPQPDSLGGDITSFWSMGLVLTTKSYPQLSWLQLPTLLLRTCQPLLLVGELTLCTAVSMHVCACIHGPLVISPSEPDPQCVLSVRWHRGIVRRGSRREHILRVRKSEGGWDQQMTSSR